MSDFPDHQDETVRRSRLIGSRAIPGRQLVSRLHEPADVKFGVFGFLTREAMVVLLPLL